MRKSFLFLLVCTLFLVSADQSFAEVFSFDDPDVSSWYTDRYDPAAFDTESFDGDNRLHIGLEGDDQQTDSFYNYQGKKHDFGDSFGTHSIVGDLYVGDAWETGDWNVGIWGTIKDAAGDISAYPIMAYRNNSTDAAGFYGFDYYNGGWYSIADVNDFGEWYSLEMKFTGTSLEHYINGALSGTFADTGSHDNISNIILNAYNFGSDYDVYWDNVGTRAVPEPSTMLLLGFGLVGLAGLRRKKKK